MPSARLAGRGPARRSRRLPAKGVSSRTVLPFRCLICCGARPRPHYTHMQPMSERGMVKLDAEIGGAAARIIGVAILVNTNWLQLSQKLLIALFFRVRSGQWAMLLFDRFSPTPEPSPTPQKLSK